MTSRDHDRTSRISGPAIGKGHGKTPKNRRSGERGNVFFTLFGAVAIVGVLGAGIMATMRGPLSTMVEVNRIEQAKAEMKVSGRFIIGESEGNTTCTGDTDISTGTMVEYVEPIDPQACGTAPTGGGCIPMSSGATKTDPWGMRYGYCAWNHGPDSTSCAGTHLQGTESTNFPTVAIISAGPDRIFQSTCGNDPAYATKAGDDIVVSFTYNDAVTTSGGLWTPVGTDQASISRDLAVTGGATFSETVDLSGTATAQLRLGAASMVLPDENDLTDLMCTSTAANDGLLRVNSTTMNVEICDNPSGFKSAGSVWTKTGNDISYSAGKVTAGAALDVTGATTLTGALDVTGATTLTGTLTVSGTNATTLGGTLGVTGDTTLSGALGVTGATTLNSTLDVTGDVDVNSQLTITAASGNLDTNGTINTDIEYQIDATKMLSNDNVTSNILLGDVASPTPGTTADYLNIGDVLHGDLQNKRVAIGFADTYDVSTLTDTLTVNGTISATGISIAPNTSGNILVNDGSSFKSEDMGGDATIDLNGDLTIADNAIDNSKMDDNAIGTSELQDDSVTADKISDTGGTNDQCLRISGGAVVWADCGTGSGPGGTNTIAEVLAAGNDADGEDLVDLGDLEVNGSIVINGGGTASSVFTVTSTTNGVLLPRMTIAQRNAIAGPAEGLLVYVTDAGTSGIFQFYDGTGWIDVGAGGAASISPDSIDWDDMMDAMTLDATTTIAMDGANADLNFDTNTFVIDSSANSVGIGTATPSYKFHVNQAQNASTMSGVQNMDTGASAQAGLVAESDAGQLMALQRSIAGGGLGLVGNTSSAGFSIFSQHATAGGLAFSTGPALALRMGVDSAGRVGIGISGGLNTIAPTAILDIQSTTQGALLPRMTTAQRTAIATPAEGLIVYDTDLDGLYYYNAATPAWTAVTAAGVGANSIDWDDMIDAMTLDATTTIAMGSYDLNFDANTLVIDSSANAVGIGTNTPVTALDVNGGVRVGSMAGNAPTYMALNSLSDVNSAPTDGQCLVYNNTASEWQAGACGGAGSIAADALDWDKLVDAMTLDATTTINMDTNNADFNFDTNTFFIDSSANSVGVGTATPKLYPSAATGLTVSSAGTPATTSVVEIQGNQTTDANVGGVLFYNSTNLNAAIISNRSGADNSGNMLFYTSTTGTLTERMRIHSTGRISIGPTIADATAVLDVQSTTQGFLTPRMTTAQRTAIATPANGLMVFDTDLRAFYYYDLTGTAWRAIGTGSNAAKIIDADGDTQIQVEEGADDDTIRFDTAGTERAVISSNGNMGIGTATPGAKLDVVGDVGVSNYLKFGGVTGNAPVYIGPALDALSDVEVPTPTNGQCLIYNSGTSTWVNGACGGTVGDDTLDWDKFTDTMTLDATTTINMDTNNADLNFDANTFFIDSSASSIGIGTTTPVMNLDIMGGASAGLGVAVPGTASGQAALTLFTMRSDLTKWLGQDNTNKGWHMGAYSNAYTTAALQNALTIVNWNGTTYGSGVVFFPSGAVQLNNGVETPSAMMDINSTTRGFLAPRMSTAQRTAIASPANGLMVFDTDLRAFYYYDLTIAAWRAIGGESTSLSDADADTRVLVEKNADEDFVRIETAGTERVTVNNGGNVGIGTTTPANRLHVVGDIRTSTSLVLGLTAGNAPTYISGAATSVSDADGDTKIQVEEGTDDDTIRFDTANAERVTISNAGAVSIAASTGVELTVAGDINYSGVLTDTSDMRLKTDIKPLEAKDVIEKLGLIDTYTFHMKNNPHGPMEYGVMAQELEKIFPELVSTADDEMGTKSVNYIGLIAPMIEGVKTLKAENESLKAEIAAMKTAQADLVRDVEGLKVHTEYGISRAAYDNWLVLVMMAMMGGMFFMLLRRKV